MLLYVWDKNYFQIMSPLCPLRLKVGGNVPPGPMVAPPMRRPTALGSEVTVGLVQTVVSLNDVSSTSGNVTGQRARSVRWTQASSTAGLHVVHTTRRRRVTNRDVHRHLQQHTAETVSRERSQHRRSTAACVSSAVHSTLQQASIDVDSRGNTKIRSGVWQYSPAWRLASVTSRHRR